MENPKCREPETECCGCGGEGTEWEVEISGVTSGPCTVPAAINDIFVVSDYLGSAGTGGSTWCLWEEDFPGSVIEDETCSEGPIENHVFLLLYLFGVDQADPPFVPCSILVEIISASEDGQSFIALATYEGEFPDNRQDCQGIDIDLGLVTVNHEGWNWPGTIQARKIYT